MSSSEKLVKQLATQNGDFFEENRLSPRRWGPERSRMVPEFAAAASIRWFFGVWRGGLKDHGNRGFRRAENSDA